MKNIRRSFALWLCPELAVFQSSRAVQPPAPVAPTEPVTSTLPERLRSERKRLGLTQVQLADAGGVKKNAQINYESGKRNPDTAYLQSLQNHGVDVCFILTGTRLIPTTKETV